MKLPVEIKEVTEIRNDIENMSDVEQKRLFEILKNSTNRTLSAAIIQTLYIAQVEFPGFPILYSGSISEALDKQCKIYKSLMYVLDIFSIKDEGTIITGYVLGVEIHSADELVLLKADGRDLHTRCLKITEHPSGVASIQIDKLKMSEVSQGDCLVKR